MPVLSLACHLPHNAPHIPWRYNYEQTTKQTKAINNSYIYINISCKCDTNRAGHLTLDAYASRPVACLDQWSDFGESWQYFTLFPITKVMAKLHDGNLNAISSVKMDQSWTFFSEKSSLVYTITLLGNEQVTDHYLNQCWSQFINACMWHQGKMS